MTLNLTVGSTGCLVSRFMLTAKIPQYLSSLLVNTSGCLLPTPSHSERSTWDDTLSSHLT